jgi:prevent-host-death family protein
MEKHMSTEAVAGDWDRVLLDVAQDDNSIIIEQEGEPVAALVPIHMYKQLRRAQEEDTDVGHRRRSDIRDEMAD